MGGISGGACTIDVISFKTRYRMSYLSLYSVDMSHFNM